MKMAALLAVVLAFPLSAFSAPDSALLLSGDNAVVTDYVVVGSAKGAPPRVRVIEKQTGELKFDFLAYDAAFTGGVRVATGDINGDGIQDIITAPGAGTTGAVRVFNGVNGSQFSNALGQFTPFDPAFTGGVYVAAADVNADGYADVVAGPGTVGSGTQALIISGSSLVSGTAEVLEALSPDGAGFGFGIRTAAGFINTDANADILLGAGKEGAGLELAGFYGGSFFPLISGNFSAVGSGVDVGVAQVDGNDGDDFVFSTAGSGIVSVFSSTVNQTTGLFQKIAQFRPFGVYNRGINVSLGDINGDGLAELLVGRKTGVAKTQLYTAPTHEYTELDTVYKPGKQKVRGRMSVAFAEYTGDSVPDCIQGDDTGNRIKVFDGVTGARIRAARVFSLVYKGGVMVAAGDVDADGVPDIIAAMKNGGSAFTVLSGSTSLPILSGTAFDAAFTGGIRVATGDVNGDGRSDIIAGQAGGGGRVRVFSGSNGAQLLDFLPYSPSFTGGVNVAAGDVNGDGTADVITGPVSGAQPVRSFLGTNGSPLSAVQAFPPTYTGPISVGALDLTGDSQAEIVAVANTRDPETPHVRVFSSDGLTQLGSFFAFPETMPSAINLVVANIDNQAGPELLLLPNNGASGRFYKGTLPVVRAAGVFHWFRYQNAFQKWESVAITRPN